ncbi:efflux RND transporter periplasmic adaptor subunit [Marinobacterium arenosum]|uniref:efflux RND transporter periplasmic adaptor subunit n=1 Tax=Marinobacterium arenosum TaxID=2862496 RepID=UPI001C96AB88|nr:efflux RND transporter periplasmic adaptor subunit [Marinobacterium arenosum]MBY4677297.1 efflux RND transporter periplasmic adaptor subunit [Marinobacterium arenosum]
MNTQPLLSIRRKQPVLLALATALSLAILSGCSDSNANVGQAPYYHRAQSDQLQLQPGYQVARTFIGKVQAKQNASIGFEQSGKVAKLFVDEGETVRQGELLARQDIELLSIERQELEAQLKQTNADLALVQANLKRLRSLKKRGFTSEQSLDELQAQQKVLQATRQRVHASLNANQLRIDKASLHAPFDAVVSSRLIDQGEVVAAGAPAMTLLQRGPAEVKVGVPVEMLDQLQERQQLSVRVGQRQYPVRLLTKGSDVDPATRTVQLRFELLGEPALVNGQLAYLQLTQHYPQAGYWVPLTALTDGLRGLWNIYTLQPTEDDRLFQLQSRNVQVLHATAEQAYVSGALEPGERILTAGLQRLVPGQTVSLASDERLAGNTP